MEFLDGQSLARRIDARGRLEEGEAAMLLRGGYPENGCRKLSAIRKARRKPSATQFCECFGAGAETERGG